MGAFNDMAERKIREAIENNEFEDIGGIDKKIDNKSYFATPEEYRMTYHILKNSGVLPEEADLRKHIAALSRLIKNAKNADEVRELYQKQLHLQTKYNLLMEKRKNK